MYCSRPGLTVGLAPVPHGHLRAHESAAQQTDVWPIERERQHIGKVVQDNRSVYVCRVWDDELGGAGLALQQNGGHPEGDQQAMIENQQELNQA